VCKCVCASGSVSVNVDASVNCKNVCVCLCVFDGAGVVNLCYRCLWGGISVCDFCLAPGQDASYGSMRSSSYCNLLTCGQNLLDIVAA